MSRIVIANWGSYGAINPHLGLALAIEASLEARGIEHRSHA